MKKTFGRVALPGKNDFLEEIKDLLEHWGADTIRDSSDTKLDEGIRNLDAKIYTTYFVARGYSEPARQRTEGCQQIYLVSAYALAAGEDVRIALAAEYFNQQITPDYDHDPERWWEVIDRISGAVVAADDWGLDQKHHTVIVHRAQPFHEYTVSFPAYIPWGPTQMYNHITNDWGNKPREIPFGIYKPCSRDYVVECSKRWLQEEENKRCDIVRPTTFFYHFTLIFSRHAKEKLVDWRGHGASVSTKAILAFKQELDYRLRPEVFTQNGYRNSTFCVPTEEYRDYIDFTRRFVSERAKGLVDLVHEAGKEAMTFLSDNWIGTEPYGAYFPSIGLDAVVGSVGDGATLHLISGIPGVKYHEGQFLPYFFPDIFHEGNDPVIETMGNWLSARHAITRKPINRIDYGGYPSLAYKLPKFVKYVEKACEEFHQIYDIVHEQTPYCGLKVAVLSHWGALRSWHVYMVAHDLYCKQIYSYSRMLESLSGASVDITFISLDELLEHGIPVDVDVIINAGDTNTTFSSRDIQKNEMPVSMLRAWVYSGHDLVGTGEPTACEHDGRFSQLTGAFGVDKELDFTLHTDKYFHTPAGSHFTIEDVAGPLGFGERIKNIYALYENTEIIAYNDGEVSMAARAYRKGRCVYIARLLYNTQNMRILLRALYYAACKEEASEKWYTDGLYCGVHAYPQSKQYAILNNTNEIQETGAYDGEGGCRCVTLQPGEVRWMVMK